MRSFDPAGQDDLRAAAGEQVHHVSGAPEDLMGIVVLGKTLDGQTRCIHFSGPTDIVAIKFHCCGSYYPCFECHRDCADHEARQWPASEWDARAILCGACGTEHTIRAYLDVDSCPSCGADFNERCRLHRHLYFATNATTKEIS